MAMKNTDKIKCVLLEVAGLGTAIHGMRNPMNSWDKSDSTEGFDEDDWEWHFTLGAEDEKLAQKLIKAGPEHRKFLRQTYVSFNAVLPRYVWSEFDTYQFVTKNSCSTMHKLLQKDVPIVLEDFVYDEIEEPLMESIIQRLNVFRRLYFNDATPDKNEILRRAKQLLPEGYLQRRTVTTNYEQLRNIYYQRKNHRLPEWRVICNFIEELPYANELILCH